VLVNMAHSRLQSGIIAASDRSVALRGAHVRFVALATARSYQSPVLALNTRRSV